MGLCLRSVELLEEAQLPIRVADQPGVLQAQPGSGNRCQALAETCCQACALAILQGHLISNSGQRQSSTEVLEKQELFPSQNGVGGVLLVCLSHILYTHEYCSACPRGSAEGTGLVMDLCKAWLLHTSAWIMGSFEKKGPQFSFSVTQGYLLPGTHHGEEVAVRSL